MAEKESHYESPRIATTQDDVCLGQIVEIGSKNRNLNGIFLEVRTEPCQKITYDVNVEIQVEIDLSTLLEKKQGTTKRHCHIVRRDFR